MDFPNAAPYAIENASEIYSPGLVIFRDLLERNLDEMVRITDNKVIQPL